MNTSTRMLEGDDFMAAEIRRMRSAHRRRVRKVRRWLFRRAWRLVITSPMAGACIGIWALVAMTELFKRIGGAA